MSASAGAGAAPLRGGALAITSIALALGTFMQVLDGTIANVSLPTIAGNLGVSTDNVLCWEAAAGFGQQISMRRQPSARHAF